MTFYRLLKPLWGKKFIEQDDKKVPNPDLVEEIDGPNTVEGIFDEKFISEKNQEGYNVYWFPNHPSKDIYSEKSYLNGRDIDVFEYLFVDMDLKDGNYETKDDFYKVLSDFQLVPTLTLDSGNGVHAYWEVKDLTRESYVILQKRLIQHFKTDESIWTVLQLMRFPGSQNTKKHGEFKQTEVIEELSGQSIFEISQFDEILPEITDVNLKKAQDHLDRLDGKITVDLSQDINIDELPEEFLKILHSEDRIYQLFTNPKETYGDRSGADLALTNILFSSGLTRKDALSVIANSQKALSKGVGRLEYAIRTVDLVYHEKVENKFKTVGDKIREGRKDFLGERVNGPDFLDCTIKGWRKGQLLGVIAGPGIGKTSVALKSIQEIIQNNTDRDEVYVFFSLEMPEYEIEERWIKLVGDKSPLADKLYVIGNEDENGEPRNITLQDIYWYSQDIKKLTGKKLGAIVIDHIHIVNRAIDITKDPTFQAESEIGNGKGNIRPLSMNTLCNQLKALVKMLDTFGIVLTQTTKDKGRGDIAIGVDGAWGISNYEWTMDFVISCWQPLMRIQKESDLRILSWQYCKIRGKEKNDPVNNYEPQLLHYDLETGDLRQTSGEEYLKFQELLPLAEEARRSYERKEATSYSRGPNLKDLQKLKLI